ncbi:MFS transporter [Brucella lupini]|uniref:MFS transporter n=1 Tax=Brucella lupini TaxID=255457 RepID=A0A256H135_9HYPH|nr:MFS transporter [Brucella lupini]KAB2699019.1 MFS transporter [Brucella lupini]OYR32766.1 major Facilitator Superfamily protein [Brucella lupini]
MVKAYIDFTKTNWRQLLFGALLMALSSFGQTYFVAVSGSYFRQSFNLSDGGLGATYAAGTILSAMTLTWAGRLIDYTTVRRFTWAVSLLLAAACVLVAVSANFVMLAVAFYFLRLGGQGLMTHTALTATARAFPQDAGKALGIIALGLSFAQGLFPIAGVTMMEQFGWRTAWLLNAGLVVAGVAIALLFLPRPGDKALRSRNDRSGDRSSTEPLWRDRRLLLTFPAMLAGPFVVTGFFFHQARLAEQKGWDISVVAASFAAFAIVQAVASVVVGPLIDKMGPKRLLPVFLLPQALAMLLIGFISVPWIAPVYMVLMAASMAFGATLATALWVDLFGAMELARVRSAVEAGTVIASGASPIIMGILIDAGIPLSWQALACCAYAVLASAATIGVMRTKSSR